MKFTAVFLATLVFCQGALAQLTPAQVVDAINVVTTECENASSVLSQLNTSTPGPQVEAAVTTLEDIFGIIISDVSADITATAATPSFPPDAADPIIAALDDFGSACQLMLENFIGKHIIFAQFQITAPIAAILRQLEAVGDSFAFALVGLIPNRASDIANLQNALDVSIANCSSTYESSSG